MTTYECRTCGARWSNGPTRDYRTDQQCVTCRKDAAPDQSEQDARDGRRYRALRDSGKYAPDAFGRGWCLSAGPSRDVPPADLDAAADAVAGIPPRADTTDLATEVAYLRRDYAERGQRMAEMRRELDLLRTVEAAMEQADRERAANMARALQAEQDLAKAMAWNTEARIVMNDARFDEVAKALHLPLGSNIAAQILPRIQEILEAAQNMLEIGGNHPLYEFRQDRLREAIREQT